MRSIEKRLGRTMSDIMNEAVFVAWSGILISLPMQGLAYERTVSRTCEA